MRLRPMRKTSSCDARSRKQQWLRRVRQPAGMRLPRTAWQQPHRQRALPALPQQNPRTTRWQMVSKQQPRSLRRKATLLRTARRTVPLLRARRTRTCRSPRLQRKSEGRKSGDARRSVSAKRLLLNSISRKKSALFPCRLRRAQRTALAVRRCASEIWQRPLRKSSTSTRRCPRNSRKTRELMERAAPRRLSPCASSCFRVTFASRNWAWRTSKLSSETIRTRLRSARPSTAAVDRHAVRPISWTTVAWALRLH